ncbi:SusC/RagA family TonB-linked outer membrane protein [Ulvibacterium marinum]|uniref:SusC/RagA family TonB-linked outer membrane protein n=1 Tax=Ulvibacterium marinum TaxID=2419782 RepID=UPI002494D52F|nr:SusC/RagA family TonB-linked outer membrane protein [Ulvibacterium marinum]
MDIILKRVKEKRSFKGFSLSLLFLLFGIGGLLAQNLQVTGTVTAEEDGMPLPGVTILVADSNNGETTDFDGNYSISVPANATLEFSYIGFETKYVAVNSQTTINVVLSVSAEALDEVVVTALGIKRSDKSLGYDVEKVGSEELTRVAQENVLNSLSGKVTGVTLNNTGGTGSSVSMVIRGAISLSSDNQPLFVIDGVPVESSLNNVGGFGNRNRVDYGNAISDLDPNSIEDVTILKGASAAALYGSRAGNGVVLITTKKAKKGQKMTVNVVTNTVFDIPVRFLDAQHQFGSGFLSYSPESQGGSYILPDALPAGGNGGPELDRGYYAVQWNAPLDANGQPIPTELVSHPNNVENFVNTGITTTNSITVSNSSDVLNYRLGVTNMANTGIIPNSDIKRNSLSLSVSSELNKKLTISTNINFVNSYADNRPASNRGANPLEWAYKVPANIDIRDLRDYDLPGTEVLGLGNASFNNPWFLANEINNSFSRYRIYGNVGLEWKLSPNFSIRSSYNLNYFNQTQETKMAPGYAREANNGTYGIAKTDGLETNVDILATYTKDFGNFDFSISGGGNLMYQRQTGLINSAFNGAGLIAPNLFTVDNIAAGSLNYSSFLRERGINSVFGTGTFGFMDMLYLDVTARNDWSSTLPVENRSYFYPSASVSFLVSELVDIPKVDLLKLRAGWAQVGNDTSPYRLGTFFNNGGQWGNSILFSGEGTLNTPDLEPEQATSLEFGLDLNMFNNRLRFEGTYYTVENKNQIINVPLAGSSGFNSVSINAGILESTGYELALGFTPVRTENWDWDLNINYTSNESKILELTEGVDFIQFWSENRSVSRGYAQNAATGEDGLVGNIYSRKILRVTDENSPYFNYPLIEPGEGERLANTEEYFKVGNYNPDFIMGLQSSLRFKNFTLNMTFDWRSGGQYMSQTSRYMVEDGYGQQLLDNIVNPGIPDVGPEMRQWVLDRADQLLLAESFPRVGGTPGNGGLPETLGGQLVFDGVFVPGVVGEYDADGNFVLISENLGDEGTFVMPFSISNPWTFGTPHMFDADFIKLREISLGYDLPSKFTSRVGIDKLSFAVYSRNIMLWTKDSAFGVDPERAFEAETSSGNRGTQFKQGIERYNVEPWVIPVGIRIGITF